MDTSNDNEFIINLNLMKQCYYFSLIDPNAKKIFGYNMNRLIFSIMLCIIHSVFVYSNLGFFVSVDYKISNENFFLVLFGDLIIIFIFYKTCLLFYRVDNIVELLDVARIDFLTSKLCRKNNKILYGYRDIIKKYSNSYTIIAIVVSIQWIMFAFLMHIFFEADIGDGRLANVVNFPYPNTTRILNKYYALIFVMESISIFTLLYCTLIIDIILLSFGWAITFQFETLGLAFKDLQQNKNRLTGNFFFTFIIFRIYLYIYSKLYKML